MVNCVVMTRMFTCCVYCGVLAMMNCAYFGAGLLLVLCSFEFVVTCLPSSVMFTCTLLCCVVLTIVCSCLLRCVNIVFGVFSHVVLTVLLSFCTVLCFSVVVAVKYYIVICLFNCNAGL